MKNETEYKGRNKNERKPKEKTGETKRNDYFTATPGTENCSKPLLLSVNKILMREDIFV